jgi:KilA-N domain
MSIQTAIEVENTNISILLRNNLDYISLTDIARYKDRGTSDDIIKNWLRNKNTIVFLGLWERINNQDFKAVEFDGFNSEAGLNSFVMTPKKWINGVNAIGVISKQGRGGGTYAHKDIAFEFASWISAEFKLYLIKEFQRLKEEETKKLKLGWDSKRLLTKVNYKVHTDAVKENLIPAQLTNRQASQIYANEADVLNMALFGVTASDWRTLNPRKKGNIRDFADISQLVCLAGLESINAEYIRQGLSQFERLEQLNRIAITQMKSITSSPSLKQLENKKGGY